MLRRALAQLPSAEDVESVLHHLEDALNATSEENLTSYIPTDRLQLESWSKGTEKFGDCDLDTMHKLIGLAEDGHIPGFNTTDDPTGQTDPWTPEGKAVRSSEVAVALQLKWHQLVGLLRLLENLLKAMSMLLMDEVGVGKTAQGLALIAMYASYFDHYDKNQRFPGMFGESQGGVTGSALLSVRMSLIA